MKLFILLFFLIIIIVICGYMENFRFVITNYTIECYKKASGLRKAVIISDLHNNSFGKDNIRLLNAVKEQKPDIIIIPGDLVNGTGDIETGKKILDLLSQDYKVYYADGNHELKVKLYKGDAYAQLFNNSAVHLDNSFETINEHTRIYGLSIEEEYYKRLNQPKFTTEQLTKKLGKNDSECYNILIAHNPAYIKQYTQWGADLVICGHYHGGFIRLPFGGGLITPQLKLFPKYSGGIYDVNNKKVVVSRGLGSHTIPFRLFNTPELVVLNFETDGSE